MPDQLTIRVPGFADVERAVTAVGGKVRRTPVFESERLNERVGARVLIKPECLQKTGSFKLRGATNRLVNLTKAERQRGVVAFSSGNHAQGVARAARRLGISAVIVMPSDAPAVKVAGVRRDGAEVVLYDRVTGDREAIAREIAARDNRVVVPSYDDPWIVAGQGTAGHEFASDARKMDAPLDHLICCVGGGGLISGIALAFEGLSPETKIWGAEPEAFDDFSRSFSSGQFERIAPDAKGICDALQTPTPGKITFEIVKRCLSGFFTVSDDEVRAAMRFAFDALKLVVEPGGAAALAALLHRMPEEWRGQTVGVVLTGGNVDAAQFAEIVGTLS